MNSYFLLSSILYINQLTVLTNCHTTFTCDDIHKIRIQQLHYVLRLILLINQCTNGIIRTDLWLCVPKYFLYGLSNFHLNLQATMYPSYTYSLPLESFSSLCIFSTRDVCSFCFFRVKAIASKSKINILLFGTKQA